MKQPLKEGSEVHRSSIKFVVFFLHSSFLIVLIHSDFLGCVCARVSMIYDHVVFGYGFRTEKFLQELLAKSELCVCVRFHVSAENVPVNIGTTGAFLCIPVIYYLFIYLFYASHQKPELWNHLVYLGWQVYKNPIIMYTLSSLLCFAARPLLAKFARLQHCVKRRAIRSNQTNLHYPRIHLEGSKEGKSTSEHILSCSHQADQE